MKNRIRITLGATALAGGLLAPAAVQAAAVTLTGWAHGAGRTVAVSAPGHTGPAGGFKGSIDFSPDEEARGWVDIPHHDFITYCLEIEEHFAFSSSPMQGYEVKSAADYGWSAARADGIGRVMSLVGASPGRVDSASESASLQLALWNLVYDADVRLDAGIFRETSAATLENHAHTLLADAASVANRYEVYVLSKSGSQDFLLLRQVPEPATLALCLAALGGVGLSRRRRRADAGAAAAPR
jgi:hypothetical protein